MNSCPTLQSLLPSERGFAWLQEEVEFLMVKPEMAHRMNNWDCGTTSCAWGDIVSRHRLRKSLRCAYSYKRASEELGASIREAEWLFGDLIHVERDIIASWFGNKNRCLEKPHQTAARLRKFVEYKRRRSELLGDMTTPEGRAKYETLRRQEGDHGVCAAVMRSLQQVV